VPTPKTKTRPPRAPKRATREKQAAELLAHHRRRQQRVYEALLMILSVRDEKLLRSFAILLDFVVGLAQRGPR
jgi:hypothetical protein